MKKASLMLIALLLFDIVSMFGVIPIAASSTKFYVDPPNVIDNTLQAEPPVTIKPMQDGTYKDWTWNTTTIRPNQEGTYSDWTGRIRTLNPNGHGTFGAWDSWVHITPNVNGIHTNWTGTIADWDDWPTPDGDSTVRTASFNNYNESSGFWDPPLEPRTLSIDKLRLTIVARQTNGTYPEQIRLMLVIGGSMCNGSLVSPGTSYATYIYEWPTNPRTTNPWLWSEMDSIEAGVRSQQVGATFDSQLRVTQIYVSILTGGVYTQWADWPDNDTDTGYIFAAANVGGQSSALPNHTTEDWTISKVRVTIVAKADISTTDKMAMMVVVNGKSYNSTYFSPSTLDYTEYSVEWNMNPRWPTIPWNWTAIDALEVGVNTQQQGGGWTGEFRVTQVYVKVIEAGSYTLWNEASQDGDDSYASTIFDAKYRSSQLQDHTSESWSISRVQVSIVARTDVPTDEKLQISVIVGGKMYNSTSFLPTTTYSTYSYVWLKNPRWPALSWNWTAIDVLQAGVKSVQSGTQWKGELRVTQLYVVVGRSGTFTEWDDLPGAQNGDNDYVSATANLMKESSQLENPAHPAWTIGRVRVVVYARATLTTDEQVSPMVVVGGLEFPGTPITLSTTYAEYVADWGKNPLTQSGWTWGDIDTLEAGAQATVGNDKIWTGEIRVTQMYVEVVAGKFSVNITVENVVNLYTVDFRLNYTTAVLSVSRVRPGSFWSPYTPKVWIEDIDDASGSVRYMIAMPIGSSQGKDGTGPVATIDFIVDSYGYSNLTLAKVQLFGPGGVPITSFDVYDGYFRNAIVGDANLDKTVNVFDILAVKSRWGRTPASPDWIREYDVNDDQAINVFDILTVKANWGSTFP